MGSLPAILTQIDNLSVITDRFQIFFLSCALKLVVPNGLSLMLEALTRAPFIIWLVIHARCSGPPSAS